MIRFRVWHTELGRYLKDNEFYINPDGSVYSAFESYDNKNISTNYIENFSRDDFDEGYIIVEQYTGLKDKNGKEIYEGDIVDAIFPTKLRGVEEHQIWVCRFGIKRAGFVLNRETNARIFSLTFGEINAKNIAVEVIGNIHENDDLLEK